MLLGQSQIIAVLYFLYQLLRIAVLGELIVRGRFANECDFSCENITVGLVWDTGTNSSETEEREHLNLLAICDIFHLEAKATGLSRLK